MEFQTLGISYPVKVKIPPTISSRNGWIAVFDSNPFYIEKRRKRLLYSVKSPLLPRKYEDHQKRLALPEWQIVCIWSFDKGGATVELTSLLSIGPRGFGTVPFWRDRTSSTEFKGRNVYFVNFRGDLLTLVQRWLLYLMPLSNFWWHSWHSFVFSCIECFEFTCLLKFLYISFSFVLWYSGCPTL